MKKNKFHIIAILFIILYLAYSVSFVKIDSNDFFYASHIHNNEIILKVHLKANGEKVIINNNLHTSFFQTILKTSDGEFITNSAFNNLHSVEFEKASYVYIRVNTTKFYEILRSGEKIITNTNSEKLPSTFYFKDLILIDSEILRPLFRFFIINYIKLQFDNINLTLLISIFVLWIFITQYQHRIYIIGLMICSTLMFKFLNSFIFSIFYLYFLVLVILYFIRTLTNLVDKKSEKYDKLF